MPPDIDQLTTALQQAHPALTVTRMRAIEPDEPVTWVVRHPDALVDVEIESPTGDLPFQVESELAPPTVVKTLALAQRIVAERLGLRVSGR